MDPIRQEELIATWHPHGLCLWSSWLGGRTRASALLLGRWWWGLWADPQAGAGEGFGAQAGFTHPWFLITGWEVTISMGQSWWKGVKWWSLNDLWPWLWWVNMYLSAGQHCQYIGLYMNESLEVLKVQIHGQKLSLKYNPSEWKETSHQISCVCWALLAAGTGQLQLLCRGFPSHCGCRNGAARPEPMPGFVTGGRAHT